MTVYGAGKLTAMEHVDETQDKARGQERVKQTQAGAVHAHTNGTRKQVQGTVTGR